MQKLIEEIYSGDTGFKPRESEIAGYQEMRETVSDAHKAFEINLTEQAKKEFDQYLGIEADIASLVNRQAYVEGFKEGARLIVEIFTNNKG